MSSHCVGSCGSTLKGSAECKGHIHGKSFTFKWHHYRKNSEMKHRLRIANILSHPTCIPVTWNNVDSTIYDRLMLISATKGYSKHNFFGKKHEWQMVKERNLHSYKTWLVCHSCSLPTELIQLRRAADNYWDQHHGHLEPLPGLLCLISSFDCAECSRKICCCITSPGSLFLPVWPYFQLVQLSLTWDWW